MQGGWKPRPRPTCLLTGPETSKKSGNTRRAEGVSHTRMFTQGCHRHERKRRQARQPYTRERHIPGLAKRESGAANCEQKKRRQRGGYKDAKQKNTGRPVYKSTKECYAGANRHISSSEFIAKSSSRESLDVLLWIQQHASTRTKRQRTIPGAPTGLPRSLRPP